MLTYATPSSLRIAFIYSQILSSLRHRSCLNFTQSFKVPNFTDVNLDCGNFTLYSFSNFSFALSFLYCNFTNHLQIPTYILDPNFTHSNLQIPSRIYSRTLTISVVTSFTLTEFINFVASFSDLKILTSLGQLEILTSLTLHKHLSRVSDNILILLTHKSSPPLLTCEVLR